MIFAVFDTLNTGRAALASPWRTTLFPCFCTRAWYALLNTSGPPGTLGYRQKIHHFFFSHKWGTRFKYLSNLCPYILMYSALHIMQWFSQVLDVFTPKIKRKFFDFYILWIKTNVAYTRLEMIARTKYCTTTTASNWFVTLYYIIASCSEITLSSKHGRWRSSLLLYSISMVNGATLIQNSLIPALCMLNKNWWFLHF